MSLIVLEGIDFCGKTTQVKMLKEALEGRGYAVETSEEPTKSLPIGVYIRDYARTTPLERRAIKLTEALLFYADRFDHLERKIIPWLFEKKVVILDRYWYSTYAYQVRTDNPLMTEIHLPEIIELLNKCIVPANIALYLDVSIDTARSRAEEAGRELTIFEHSLGPVRFNYMTLCNTHKLVRIDGMLEPEEVHREVLRQVVTSGALRVF